MAKLEKHKKNLIQEWMEAEESSVPARPRGSDQAESREKIRKPPVAGKARLLRPSPPAAKPEPALIREPAAAPRTQEKHSQAASREHLLKLERLSQLRAPFSFRSRKPAPSPVRRPTAVASRAARRASGGRRAR